MISRPSLRVFWLFRFRKLRNSKRTIVLFLHSFLIESVLSLFGYSTTAIFHRTLVLPATKLWQKWCCAREALLVSRSSSVLEDQIRMRRGVCPSQWRCASLAATRHFLCASASQRAGPPRLPRPRGWKLQIGPERFEFL
jgi:hypothetical protein